MAYEKWGALACRSPEMQETLKGLRARGLVNAADDLEEALRSDRQITMAIFHAQYCLREHTDLRERVILPRKDTSNAR